MRIKWKKVLCCVGLVLVTRLFGIIGMLVMLYCVHLYNNWNLKTED
jgi:hypothetical protein